MSKARKRLYIAYGSNLNLEQMARRCPTAKEVGTAVLKDYRLLFRGGNGSAVATVEPSCGDSVPVLVWELQPLDEDSLDRYEGWPHLYRKESMHIRLNGKTVSAMIYIMNEGYQEGAPSVDYFYTILTGYNSAGFDTDALSKAVLKSMGKGRDQYGR